MAWLHRWSYLFAYRVDLRFTYKAEIGVIDVQMGAALL